MERILGGLPMTQPLSDIPPVEEPILGGDVRSIFRPDETKLDKAKGLADAGLSLFGALVHGVPAQFMGKMGPEFQAKRFRPPQTPAGERYFDVAAEALGKVAEAFPMQPTAFTSPANVLAGPAMAQAGAKSADVNAMAQKALQAAGGRLEKAVEKQVYSTMEKGGLPAEILQGMTQGTQSFMVPQRVEAPRNEMKLYSPAEEAALNLQRGQGRGEGFLNDLKKAGVKDEELEYTGLKDFLAGKQNVSKKEIQDYLAENKVQLGEVQLGHRTRSYEGLTNQIDELRDKIISAQEDFQNSGYLFREIRDDKMLNELPFDWQLKYDKIVNMKEMLEKLENQRYDLPKGEPTRHSQWTLPGGENYREILLTLPSDSMTTDQIAQKLFGKQMRFLSEAEKDEVVQESRRLFENRTDYRSSHWDQPNVLAHLRVNDRVDADGKKMLLIEEIQSDWHQAGREKGYASKSGQLPAGWEVVEVPKYGYRGGPQIGTEFMVFDRSKTQVGFASPTREGAIANATGSSSLGVPDAPFKEDWYQLVLKRALQEAVDKGYDRVGITTGKRQIDRYTDALRANVDAIEYEPFKTDAGEIRYEVVGVKNGKPVVELDDLSYKDLQEKVGKEIAEKIRANAGESLAADRPMRPDWMRLSTDNLSIGGEGMKKYYDEIYPGFLNKYGKKFDAKVGETTLKLTEGVPRKGISGESEPVRYIDITPKMKEALSKGQPMFKEGGLVSNTDTIKARLIEQGMPEDKAFMQALKLANEVQMAKGGLAGLKNLPAAAKAAKAGKAVKPVEVLPPEESQANLGKFLEGSKVQDRLYHATPKSFSEFKPGGNDPTLSGPAMWFSVDPKYQPAMHNISAGKRGEFREGTNVMPVHVQAKNPLVLDDPTMIDWAQAVFAGGSREFPELIAPKWAEELRKEGYDSIIFADPRRTGQTHEVIMFEPNKIKSAIGNRGTYDVNERDITKAKGGLAGLKNLPAAARAAKSKYAEEAAAAGRAAPRSKQEIESIAQRIAEQTQPGFVRPDPAFSVNPEGKSRAVYEMEQRTPMIVESTIEDKPLPTVDYEKQLGSVIVGVPGDPTMGQVKSPGSLYEPTRAGKRLMQVGDVTPETPVELYGGPSYGTTQPESYWASNKGAAQNIKNLIDETAEKYQTDKILGQYMKMSPEGSRFAMHNLDALISILQPEKLPAKKVEVLNKMVREGDKANKFPQFVGFEDPIDLLLQAQMNSNLRKRISEVLEKPTTAKEVGFPFQGSVVQTAITEPGLRNLETGITGYSVGQMRPQAELTLSRHPTYEYDIPGQLIGRSKYPIPYELAFPDFSQWFREHPELPKKVDPFNMLKSVGARQKVDPQYVDEIKMYEEAMKRLTGKKKGGLAAMNRK
jgi:hypothetical protein